MRAYGSERLFVSERQHETRGSTGALAALVLATAMAPAFAQRSPLPPTGPIEHITGNLYKIFGGGGNTLVFVQQNGVVLVDTKLPGNGQPFSIK